MKTSPTCSGKKTIEYTSLRMNVFFFFFFFLKKCRGQCCDGGGNMSGAKNEVTAQIRPKLSRSLI